MEEECLRIRFHVKISEMRKETPSQQKDFWHAFLLYLRGQLWLEGELIFVITLNDQINSLM